MFEDSRGKSNRKGKMNEVRTSVSLVHEYAVTKWKAEYIQIDVDTFGRHDSGEYWEVLS